MTTHYYIPKRLPTMIFACVVLCLLCGTATVHAEPRKFRMAVWGNANRRYGDYSWFNIRPQDGRSGFARQPAGYSILQIDDVLDDATSTRSFTNKLKRAGYDWSRILAVIVDEAYVSRIPPPNPDHPEVQGASDPANFPNPCNGPDQSKKDKIAEVDALIANAAAATKALSPSTRFWVDFNEWEVLWMMSPSNPCLLYKSYIDVVSIDKYDAPFDDLKGNVIELDDPSRNAAKGYYDWFLAHAPKPSIQVALVPEVYTKKSAHGDAQLAAYLDGFFKYANEMNRRAASPPARRGTRAQGVVVWVVAGWKDVGSSPVVEAKWLRQFSEIQTDGKK